MPKNSRRHKNLRPGSGTGAHPAPPVSGIKDLLKRQPLLKALNNAQLQQDNWRQWLAPQLPAELIHHITQIKADRDELVVYAATAAWCARLRYALAELETDIRQHDAGIRRVQVRVQPRGRS